MVVVPPVVIANYKRDQRSECKNVMDYRSFALPTYRNVGPLPQEYSAIFTVVVFV